MGMGAPSLATPPVSEHLKHLSSSHLVSLVDFLASAAAAPLSVANENEKEKASHHRFALPPLNGSLLQAFSSSVDSLPASESAVCVLLLYLARFAQQFSCICKIGPPLEE